jgi:hypothetical protein
MMAAPSTSSVLWAQWRQGLKDLQNAVVNPWNGFTATHEELGTIGHPTPQMVTEDIRGGQSYQSMLEHHAVRGSEIQQQPEREMER